MSQPRGRAKRDANHNDIVHALRRLGVSVLDTSKMGGGFPDTILGVRGQNLLAEIKNPETYYGRSGGSARQLRFAAEWPAPVYLLFSIDDAVRVAEGKLNELRVMGVTKQ